VLLSVISIQFASCCWHSVFDWKDVVKRWQQTHFVATTLLKKPSGCSVNARYVDLKARFMNSQSRHGTDLGAD